ncbi:hypothetical protein R1flu_002186 [Riccia fluitans]|uniref:Uncharacterized protein n=1 Tax=Riccia fluitans TaxID=41844 RepID=A0ABD1Y5D2_9MARC
MVDGQIGGLLDWTRSSALGHLGRERDSKRGFSCTPTVDSGQVCRFVSHGQLVVQAQDPVRFIVFHEYGMPDTDTGGGTK